MKFGKLWNSYLNKQREYIYNYVDLDIGGNPVWLEPTEVPDYRIEEIINQMSVYELMEALAFYDEVWNDET